MCPVSVQLTAMVCVTQTLSLVISQVTNDCEFLACICLSFFLFVKNFV